MWVYRIASRHGEAWQLILSRERRESSRWKGKPAQLYLAFLSPHFCQIVMSFQMIGSFLAIFTLRRFVRLQARHGARFSQNPPCGISTVSALRLLLFAGKHQRRSHPGTPCNIKLIIFCLIKTSSGWRMCVFWRSHLHSLLGNKSAAFTPDEYIRNGSPCPLLTLSSVQPHYKRALKYWRIYSTALSAVPKQLYSWESSNNVG